MTQELGDSATGGYLGGIDNRVKPQQGRVDTKPVAAWFGGRRVGSYCHCGCRSRAADWRRIDALEVERGRAQGKTREKLTSVAQMLSVLGPD
ncbi:hypothetical protein ACFL5O_03980 [Myxococcota bacterium]